MNIVELAKAVAFRTGQVAARGGVPISKRDGKALISRSAGTFYNDLLVWIGWLEHDTTTHEYADMMHLMVDEYTKGYFSVPETEREVAQAKAKVEDEEDAARQRVVDIIQQHFPGSIIVPL